MDALSVSEEDALFLVERAAWSSLLKVPLAQVPKEVPEAETVRLSGRFLTKVFEGPFKDTGKWCEQMAEWIQSKGETMKKQLMYYTTCPKCAKHYGKNYVVIFAEVGLRR